MTTFCHYLLTFSSKGLGQTLTSLVSARSGLGHSTDRGLGPTFTITFNYFLLYVYIQYTLFLSKLYTLIIFKDQPGG